MDASLLWLVVAMNALTAAQGRGQPLRRAGCVADGAAHGAVALMLRSWRDRFRRRSAATLAQPEESRVRSGWIRALCDVAFVPAQRTSRRRD